MKVGVVVHIPASVFPEEPAPPNGFWIGKTVRTKKGGALDVGILCDGDKHISKNIFTRLMAEVAGWVVQP